MTRKLTKRLPYLKPQIEIIETDSNKFLLTGSYINGEHQPGYVVGVSGDSKQNFIEDEEIEE